jgi:hypothetical protein
MTWRGLQARSSFDLGIGHRPGRLRIYVLLSADPVDPDAVTRAARLADGAPPASLGIEGPIKQFAGTLLVDP